MFIKTKIARTSALEGPVNPNLPVRRHVRLIGVCGVEKAHIGDEMAGTNQRIRCQRLARLYAPDSIFQTRTVVVVNQGKLGLRVTGRCPAAVPCRYPEL